MRPGQCLSRRRVVGKRDVPEAVRSLAGRAHDQLNFLGFKREHCQLLLPEDDARDIFCACCTMAASRFSRVKRTSLFRQLADAPMKLTAYVLDGHEVAIRPAPVDREWMEATNERFAYRCLPLNIANAHGWEILCRSGFSAVWNGQSGARRREDRAGPRHHGARYQSLRPWNFDLPRQLPFSHRARLRSHGAGA